MRRNKKHGTGYLFQKAGAGGTPSGVYYARWVVGGKYFTRSTRTSNRREAEKRLAEYTAEIVAGDSVQTLQNMVDKLGGERARYKAAQDAKPALSLANAGEAFANSIRRRRCAPITERIYQTRIAAFVEWAKKRAPEVVEMREVSPEMAADFMREIRRKNSPKTFNDYRAILLQVWKTLDREARWTCNPWNEIAPLDRATNRRRELTKDEILTVLHSLTGEMHLLFLIGICTGQRLGDCVRLTWDKIDLELNRVYVKPHKTARLGKHIKLPIEKKYFRPTLLAVPPAKRRGPLVPGLLSEYLRHSAIVCEKTQAAFRAVGIETSEKKENGRAVVAVGFHSLRHTFVSLMANAGIPFAVVQAIVGHSCASMTEHYFHVSDEALDAAFDALPDFSKQPAGQPALPPPVDGSARKFPPVGNGEIVGVDLQAVAAAIDCMTESELAAVGKMISRRRRALSK